jgi:IS30 family transposase
MGRPPLVVRRLKYFELVDSGVRHGQACLIVGVARVTGYQWRRAREVGVLGGGAEVLDHAVVAVDQDGEISSRYLTLNERLKIADLRREGLGPRAIARAIDRDPATVSRELRRNAQEGTGAYRPFAAQKMAEQRRPRPKTGRLVADAELRAFVEGRLRVRWSPEQIADALRKQFPDQPQRHLAVETIYQAIYRPELGGLCRNVPKALRTGRLRRKPPKAGGRHGRIVGMTMIDKRPVEAATRTVAGHWEGDLIIGQGGRSAIGTLVDRASRYLILVHLPNRHTAEELRDALIAAMSLLPQHLRRTLTWDQGKELALHAEIAEALDMPIFFCERSSPWQRPTNENTNGLLRQYFPKGTNLRQHDAEHLAAVADELNDRPRKVMGFTPPRQRLAELTAAQVPEPAAANA